MDNENDLNDRNGTSENHVAGSVVDNGESGVNN